MMKAKVPLRVVLERLDNRTRMIAPAEK